MFIDMEKLELEQLKPIEFFKWFYEICKIPHGSKNEKELINFLVDFAKKRKNPSFPWVFLILEQLFDYFSNEAKQKCSSPSWTVP